MRITPLHNIREPGLIPNGFQKEDASPPAPDPRMQPEMRNRVEAQTDTRHAIEFLNPRTRLETNDANRANNTDPPRIEMGQEPHLDRSAAEAAREKPVELNDDYERLLRILLGQKPSATQPAPPQAELSEGAKEAAKPLEMEGTGAGLRRKIEAYHQASHLSTLMEGRNNVDPESAPPAQAGNLTYNQRKAISAYRAMQSFAPGSNMLHQV